MAALLAACAPYRIEYEHLMLDDVPGLTVVTRSSPPDSSADKVRRARYDLPVLSTLKREAYTLTIDTPANSSYPMLFVGARDASGNSLRLEGKHLRSVHPDALIANADHPFTFMTREADGDPVEFVIRDASGKQVGAESLEYEIVTSGVIWGIEYI
jgi:hypothetical protein